MTAPLCLAGERPTGPSSQQNLPVFPEASGFGTTTPAGRGGKIIRVTNLESRGAGSLKAALEASGPRVIVFEVGGTIDWADLGSHLTLREPYVTIAGQTAPFPGITIKGSGLRVITHDVLIQHLRIRVDNKPETGSRDGIMVLGAAERVVIDHVSISGATNEGFVTWESPKDITLSNSIVTANTRGEMHGLLLGDLSRNVALIGNLISENPDRNPLLKGGTSVLLANNVVYNPGSGTPCIITDDYDRGPSQLSLVGNVFLAGPQTIAVFTPALVSTNKKTKPGSQIYQTDNLYTDRNGDFLPLFSRDALPYLVNTSPLPLNDITLYPSRTVLARVVTEAGARPTERDRVDQLAIEHLLNRTGPSPLETTATSSDRPIEPTRRTLKLPDNPHGDRDGDGYTNLEEYLQQMASKVEGRPVDAAPAAEK